MDQDLSNSHLFKYQQDINQICQPLFDASDIGFFSLGRVYKNQSRISLSTYPELVKELIDSKTLSDYHWLSSFLKNDQKISCVDNIHFSFSHEDNRDANKIEKKYGLMTPLMLLDQQKDDIDCFVFASRNGKNIIKDYFSNWEYLIKFKSYFLHQANKLVKNASKTKIMGYNRNNLFENIVDQDMFNKNKFSQLIKLKYYYLSYKKKRYKLTAKQLECLKLFSRGYDRKEIAKVMNISPRTVEGYHDRLQNIFQVNTRKKMIDIFLESDLSSLKMS